MSSPCGDSGTASKDDAGGAVSDHGRAPGTSVGAAGAGDVPVIFDSGVRGGEHVVKALALGATAVGIGRPYAYGLAVGGEDGIVHVLRSLLAEADLLMAVDGYRSVRDLTPDALLVRR